MSKVSILLPVYNNKDDIVRAINSVRKQTYKNWELIIIDDASSDGLEIFLHRHIKGDKKIIFIKNQVNLGCYISLNEGLKIASGNYITCLGSDDAIHPLKIAKQVQILNKNPKLKGVITLYQRGAAIRHYGSSTLMFRKEIIEKIGYYDSVRFAADCEFLSRIKTVYGKKAVKRLNRTLYYAKKRINSLTTSKEIGTSDVGKKIRIDYVNNYKSWHRSKSEIYMAYPLIQRPFEVDELML